MSRPTMSEKDLQRTVNDLLDLYGWLHFHDQDSRRNRAGFPDICAVHPMTGRLIFRELKSEKGRVRPEQHDWIESLQTGGHDVAIWRPRHLHDGTIQTELARKE